MYGLRCTPFLVLEMCIASKVLCRGCSFLGSRGSEESLGHAEWLALTGQAVWSALEPGSTWMFKFYQAPWKGRDRGRAVRVAVYCFLGTDAALTECLQLRGPNRLVVPGLTAVTILETGQGPGQ